MDQQQFVSLMAYLKEYHGDAEIDEIRTRIAVCLSWETWPGYEESTLLDTFHAGLTQAGGNDAVYGYFAREVLRIGGQIGDARPVDATDLRAFLEHLEWATHKDPTPVIDDADPRQRLYFKLTGTGEVDSWFDRDPDLELRQQKSAQAATERAAAGKAPVKVTVPTLAAEVGHNELRKMVGNCSPASDAAEKILYFDIKDADRRAVKVQSVDPEARGRKGWHLVRNGEQVPTGKYGWVMDEAANLFLFPETTGICLTFGSDGTCSDPQVNGLVKSWTEGTGLSFANYGNMLKMQSALSGHGWEAKLRHSSNVQGRPVIGAGIVHVVAEESACATEVHAGEVYYSRTCKDGRVEYLLESEFPRLRARKPQEYATPEEETFIESFIRGDRETDAVEVKETLKGLHAELRKRHAEALEGWNVTTATCTLLGKDINNNSGHYHPLVGNLENAIGEIRKQGLFMPGRVTVSYMAGGKFRDESGKAAPLKATSVRTVAAQKAASRHVDESGQLSAVTTNLTANQIHRHNALMEEVRQANLQGGEGIVTSAGTAEPDEYVSEDEEEGPYSDPAVAARNLARQERRDAKPAKVADPHFSDSDSEEEVDLS